VIVLGFARQMVHVLGAAIVMIAVYLMPSVAFAHSAHETGRTAGITTGEHVGVSRATAEPGVETTWLAVGLSGALATGFDPQDDAARPCSGSCCHMADASCCSTALPGVEVAQLPLEMIGVKVSCRNAAVSAAATPDGPRKPPRSFA
jgi:hypothetical protein